MAPPPGPPVCDAVWWKRGAPAPCQITSREMPITHCLSPDERRKGARENRSKNTRCQIHSSVPVSLPQVPTVPPSTFQTRLSVRRVCQFRSYRYWVTATVSGTGNWYRQTSTKRYCMIHLFRRSSGAHDSSDSVRVLTHLQCNEGIPTKPRVHRRRLPLGCHSEERQ